MKILIVSQWYPPEPMKLLSDMAEGLVKLGNQVTVLTGNPNWPYGKIYSGYNNRCVKCEHINGVKIIRVPLYPDHSSNGIGRALNILSFNINAVALGMVHTRRPDLVHVIQPPTTCIAGYVASRIFRVPMTYEVQDMWPETLLATGLCTSELILTWVDKWCSAVYKKSEKIRVISQGFMANLVAKGVPSRKIAVIPNWVDTDYYSVTECGGVQNPTPHRLRIVYAGTIGYAQGCDIMIKAAKDLAHYPVDFVIAGDGICFSDLKQLADTEGIRNVQLLGRLPLDDMSKLYASADALIMTLKSDPLFAMTIPHKLLSYMAAGKPLIVSADGESADIVEMNSCGFASKAEDVNGLVNSVKKLIDLTQDHRAHMGANAYRLAQNDYSYTVLIDVFNKFLHDTKDGCVNSG